MARFLPFHWMEYGDYYFQHLQLEDQIRELVFGTSRLEELGEKWGLLKEIREKQKERNERNKGKPVQAPSINKERHDERLYGSQFKSGQGRCTR